MPSEEAEGMKPRGSAKASTVHSSSGVWGCESWRGRAVFANTAPGSTADRAAVEAAGLEMLSLAPRVWTG